MLCVWASHTYYKRLYEVQSTCQCVIGPLIVCVCGSHTWTEPRFAGLPWGVHLLFLYYGFVYSVLYYW